MPARYEIVVAGNPSPVLLAALGSFDLLPAQPGETRLVGTVVDQAALHGTLHRLQDLRVDLIEVRRLDDA